MVDADQDGLLDSDEFKDFAAMTSGEPMMVCYNTDTHEIDMSINSEADCEAAGLMWKKGPVFRRFSETVSTILYLELAPASPPRF